MTRLARIVAISCAAGTLVLMVLTASTPQRLSNTKTIMAIASTGGTITPAGAIAVSHGSNQTFAINSNANFKIDRVLVDGASVGAVTGYTFTRVKVDHTIDVSFVAGGGSTPRQLPE